MADPARPGPIHTLAATMRRHAPPALLLAALGGGAGYAYARLQPAHYAAAAVVLVEPQEITLRGGGLTGTLTVAPPDRRTLATLAELPAVLVTVNDTLDGAYTGRLDELDAALTLRPGGNRAFEFAATADTPDDAAGLANAWARAVVRFADQHWASYADQVAAHREAAAALTAEIDRLAADPQTEQRRLALRAARESTQGLYTQDARRADTLRAVDSLLAQAQATAADLADAPDGTPIDPALAVRLDRLVNAAAGTLNFAAAAELIELQQPPARSIDTDLPAAAARTRLAASADALQRTRAALLAERDAIAAELAEAERDLGRLTIEDDEAARALATLDARASLLQAWADTWAQAAPPGGVLRVVEPATPPATPARGGATVRAAAGAAAGLLLGLALALLRGNPRRLTA